MGCTYLPHCDPLEEKDFQGSYWDDHSLWGKGSVEFIHLLYSPRTSQHPETPSLRESTHQAGQVAEDTPITDPRFLLHKNHGRRSWKAYWQMGNKNGANMQWLFMLHKKSSTICPELWKDSYFYWKHLLLTTAFGVQDAHTSTFKN